MRIQLRRSGKQTNELPALGPMEMTAAPDQATPRDAVLSERVSQRRFVAGLATVAGLAGAGLVSAKPRAAEAAYQAGQSSHGGDLVDTWLTVNGRLWVDGTGPGVGGWGMTSLILNANQAPANQVQQQFAHYGALRGGIAVYDTGYFVISNYDGSAVVPRIFIQPNGWVGINSMGASAPLDVNGHVRILNGLFVNGILAVDGNAAATKAYYAP